MEETQAALDKLVNSKLSAVNPANLPSQPGGPQYIKYTPAQQGQQYNSGASHRIIKMQDMPVDPLEPPKFRHMKVPRGPGSPPVPVMHSPPRPVTAQDQVNWKIPPCISNWKNAKVSTCWHSHAQTHAHARTRTRTWLRVNTQIGTAPVRSAPML